MKHSLIVLLIACSAMISVAQKHHVWADVGTAPGFSITYNYTPKKWWSFGGGVHGYNFQGTSLTRKNFIPGIFGEIRLNIRPEKKNQFTSFIDIGINLYKPDYTNYRSDKYVYHVMHNNGLGIGIGFGYMRRMTKRNGGPYISLKILTDWYRVNGYSIVSVENDNKGLNINGSSSLSVGFKF